MGYKIFLTRQNIRGFEMNKREFFRIIIFGAVGTLIMAPYRVEAFLYHATRRAVARRIITKGVSPTRFKAKARFGKGFYTSRRPSTALAEKGHRNAVLRFKEGQYLKRKNTLNLKKPKTARLHDLLGAKYNLRGAVKKNVIGPKAGRRLGRVAGKKHKVIEFRSVKNGGSNLFIPKKLFRVRPSVIKPDKIIK